MILCVDADTAGLCVWKLMLPPTPASKTPYTISVSSDKYGQATISDVLFGDVWICSGQSNMQFAVSQVITQWHTKYYTQYNETSLALII